MLSGSLVVTAVQKVRLKDFPENIKQLCLFWRKRHLSVRQYGTLSGSRKISAYIS